jgi:hypothetical protein
MTAHIRSANFLSEFFEEFILNFSKLSETEVKIHYSNKSTFLGDYSPFGKREHTISRLGEGNPDQKYDLIFVNPSFTKMVISPKESPIVSQITSTLSALKENGIAFVLLPSFELSLSNKKFIEILKQKNLFINSVLQLPDNFLNPDTSIRPLLVSITKTETPLVLFAEFENWESNSFGQFEIVSENLLNIVLQDWEELIIEQRVDPRFGEEIENIGDDLWNGVHSTFDEFLGFEYWKFNDELERINSDYKQFKSVKLGELCSAINLIKSGGEFDGNIQNCIYVPLLGTQPVVDNISKLKIKPHNYAQLVMQTECVDKNYIVSFLNSKIGKLIIDTEKSIGNRFIPKLSLKRIKDLGVKLPKIELQRRLAESVIKINEVYSKVEKIKLEIELNPLSAKDIEKLDSILNSMSEFTIQDEIRHKISIGENKKTEFKETLSLDRLTKQKNKILEHASLKTIVAFLNSDGGTLVIGVSDGQEIIGLDEEIQKFHNKDTDKFLLHLKNLIKRSIGEEFYTLIETNVVKIDTKILIVVDVLRSDSEVYLDGKEFFVRTNPSTDKLEGRKLVEYCKRRFFKNEGNKITNET